MNRLTTATVAVGLVAGSLTLGCARTARLSADEIAAKNVAARGGLEAWRKVETMMWNGRIESVNAPSPSMQFELEQKRPNKTRLLVNALGEKSLRVFDGVQGFRVRPGQGRPLAQPYTPQELKFAQSGHGIDGPLIDHAAKGNSVTLESLDEIGGRKAYHLRVRLAKGGDEEVWIDAETFLDVRYDRMADGPAGEKRRVSVTYGDYRAVEGLQIPFLIATGGGQGAAPDKMQIETVMLNSPLDDSKFENPASPHPRNRMRASVMPPPAAPFVPQAAETAANSGRGFAPQ